MCFFCDVGGYEKTWRNTTTPVLLVLQVVFYERILLPVGTTRDFFKDNTTDFTRDNTSINFIDCVVTHCRFESKLSKSEQHAIGFLFLFLDENNVGKKLQEKLTLQ
jgi:hypothetical protein